MMTFLVVILLSVLAFVPTASSAGSFTVTADDALVQAYISRGHHTGATPAQVVQTIVDRALEPMKAAQKAKEAAAACAALKAKSPQDKNVAAICP